MIRIDCASSFLETVFLYKRNHGGEEGAVPPGHDRIVVKRCQLVYDEGRKQQLRKSASESEFLLATYRTF